ncbi:carnitine O-acetyltransferase-like [Passer montanus]|uniref:carnitine O-acetyltransferase-like n=1 Tax=Passer montanus TaxID=9160 RepID=UPI0019600A82|nr:carnitine O-acetyltransferase-like [Passer montanus]
MPSITGGARGVAPPPAQSGGDPGPPPGGARGARGPPGAGARAAPRARLRGAGGGGVWGPLPNLGLGSQEWPWGSSERLPLPVHTSAGLVLPPLGWEDWRGQLWFAARFLSGVLDYREQLLRRDPPEPWVQAAFGGCRVPGSRRDEVLRVPPGAQPPPFVTVCANGQFFGVPTMFFVSL